jgi:cold shock CspA family protein
MRVRGMVTWCRDSLGRGFRSHKDGPAGFVYCSNITGEGFRTLKGVAALVTIKQLARQA